MTSPGLDPRARPIAAACVRSMRPRHRYAARQLSLLQSEGVLWFVSYHGGFLPDNMARIPPKSL
jgi:hypothetical protein